MSAAIRHPLRPALVLANDDEATLRDAAKTARHAQAAESTDGLRRRRTLEI